MNKNLEKYEELKVLVLNKIQNASKEKPAKTKELQWELSLNLRLLKEIISNLREDYPIVAKETDGGGYWIATTNEEILNFANMIEARKMTHEETITKMMQFIK